MRSLFNSMRRFTMYRIPHINFVSYKITVEQARKKVSDFAFYLYRPVLIVLIALNSAVVPLLWPRLPRILILRVMELTI